MGLERLKFGLPGLEPYPEVEVEDFVAFIEAFAENGEAFSIQQEKLQIPDQEGELWDGPPRPLVGSGGRDTYPLISDPDNKVNGGFAIIDRQLIYAPNAIPLHQMRDSYRWSFNPRRYFTDATLSDILGAFIAKGYELKISKDMIDYDKRFPYTIDPESVDLQTIVPKFVP